MEAFRRVRELDFRTRLDRHVRQVFPSETEQLGETATSRLIGVGLERARAHGPISERNISLFVDLMFGLGEDFETRPECAPLAVLLRDDRLSGDAKMFLVFKQLPAVEQDISRARAGDRS